MAKQFAVFHPGTQHSWQTALALQKLDRLAFYATSIFYQPHLWPYRIERYLPGAIARRVRAEFRRFSHPSINPALVRTGGGAEWAERLVRRAGFRGLANRIDRYGNHRFAMSVTDEIRSSRDFGVWGYDNSSIDIFRAAKAAGRACILDRTNGDWRAFNEIMSHVYEAYPEFFLKSDFRVGAERIARNDAEYELADVILTGSPFCAETVSAHAADRKVPARVRVLEYCYDERLFGSLPAPRPRPASEPLRFLFLGQAGVRKGIHLILKVFERIPPSAATLTIVGDLQVPPAIFARYADRVRYQATVARADVPALLAASDILLFPSYFEGAGLVLPEALAAGTALIQSGNALEAVTPDTGLLLPELSETALYTAVMTAIEDRQRVEGWRHAAQPAARRHYSFANYCSSIASLLDEIDP